LEQRHHVTAERLRAQVQRGQHDPADFRAAFSSVPPLERDAWVDVVFDLDHLPDDGPDLPRGCVPYIPCTVDLLLRMADQARLQPSDVFVDVGSGVGRTAAFVHLLTGAEVIGIEIQSALASAARNLMTRLHLSRVSCIEGDAAKLTGSITTGTLFFLYCPFSGERLDKVLTDLRAMARTRTIRICCVDLPLPPYPWLEPEPRLSEDFVIYRSNLLDAG
jgi:SAM-dependent methyltransferase